MVTIHDSSTTNVLIYNLLQTPIAHPHLEEEALEEEADPPPHMVEGPPPHVADVVEGGGALDPLPGMEEKRELGTHFIWWKKEDKL